MQLIKNSVMNSLSLHYKKLILMMSIYSVYIGFAISSAKTVNMNSGEFVLFVISDFRLIIFCLLPLYTFYLFSSTSKTNILQMVRYSSFNSYFIYNIIPNAVFAFLYACAPVFTALFLSILFCKPHSTAVFSDELLLYIVSYFNNSTVLAIVATTVYLFWGLLLLSIMIKFLLFTVQRKAVVLLSLTIYMLAVLGAQWNIDKIFPYVFINNYIILISAMRNNVLIINAIIYVILLTIIFVATKKRWWCIDIC